MHLIALNLSEKYNFKWIADFRDPWTNMEYFAKLPLTHDSKKKHFELQKKVISKADLTLTVSNFTSTFPGRSSRACQQRTQDPRTCPRSSCRRTRRRS